MHIHEQIGRLSLVELLASASNIASDDIAKLKALYQIWLASNPGHVQSYVVHYNLGVIFAQNKQDAIAIQYYLWCLATKPDLHEARLNLGMAYERLERLDEALQHWRVILEATKLAEEDENAKKFRVLALNNLGRVFENQKLYSLAESHYEESLQINPDQPQVIQHWGYVRQRQCAWPVHAGLAHISASNKLINAGPLALLALTDNPMTQLRAAHELLNTRFPPNNIKSICHPKDRYQHDKVRLAITSSDIANHPVALLTVPLFEYIDRNKFELYLFS
jgi:predicted O-linked N-acetylglucosamine transferase (SPINDLY family)